MCKSLLRKTAAASSLCKHGVSLLTSNGLALLISPRPQGLMAIGNLDWGRSGEGGFTYSVPNFCSLAVKSL